MTLDVDVTLERGAFTLKARFQAAGGVTALFGPSGSGKTTLVDLIAGLLRPDRGRIVVGGVVLVDTKQGIFIPPHRRGVGYVFQEGRLFPHLSVRNNLIYGRWMAGKAADRARFDRLVDLLGLDGLLGRRIPSLSGGEKQRVAIGRALLAEPRILLMDEPLASLDGERKQEILPVLERLRDEHETPIVYVSHSLPETARLATAIVVLEKGSVRAHGPARDIIARFAPTNFGGGAV